MPSVGVEELIYKPGRGVKPHERTHRYLAEPVTHTFEAELVDLINVHYLHTSRLRAVFRFAPDAYEGLVRLRDVLPVAPASEGKQTLLPGSISVLVLKYLDAELTSYRHQGRLSSVSQEVGRPGQKTTRVGDQGKVTIRVSGTSERGLIARLIAFEVGTPDEGRGYLVRGD